MTMTLTQITGTIDTPSGETPANGKVVFQLRDWDKAGSNVIVPGPVIASLDGSGALSVYLQTTTTTARGMTYAVELTYWSTVSNSLVTVELPQIAVPAAGPVSFASLITTPIAEITAPDILAQSAAHAVAAESDAVATAGDRTQTGIDRVATGADRIATGADVVSAAAAKSAAEAARDAAFTNATIYPDIATGRAAVADGAQFTVVASGATEAIRYRRDSGSTQTELARYPTRALVAIEKTRLLGWNYTRNVFIDPYFQASGAFSYLTDWNYTAGLQMTSATKNGRSGARTAASASATLVEAPKVAVSEFPSGRLSASILIEEKAATSAGADLRVRLRFYAGDGLTLVTLTDNTGSDTPGDFNAYDRYVPTAALTKPQFLNVAEGLIIPAGAVYVRMSWRIQTTSQMYWSLPLLRDGDNPAWVAPTASTATTIGDAVTAGTGGTYATIDNALDAIGGSGTIIVKHDRGYGTSMRVTTSKCRGPVRLIGEIDQATGLRPRILLAPAVTGIEAVAGYSGRIFRFPVTGMTATPPWVWLHDTPDAASAIALADRHPLHGGRANRLPSTRIKRNTAGTLAAALTAMEASNSPQCYYDSNWLYVTGVSGASLLGADIRVGTTSALFSGGSVMGASDISLSSLEVLYGGVNTNVFKTATIRNVSTIGARNNGFDHAGVTFMQSVEAAGAGAFTDPTGDGINGHTYAVLIANAVWSHDNLDDGESCHEFGRVRMASGLFERNGGTAVAPAYGCDAIYDDCESRYNQQVSGRKYAAFLAVGRPAEGSPVDTGVDTIALFRRCRSIGDTISFADNSDNVTYPQIVKAICEDCVSKDAVTQAFGVYEVSNCRVVGAATAKRSDTIVRPQGTVVT